jgi:glucokinase
MAARAVNASAELAIGLDLGGTQIRAALVDREGRVLQRRAVATAAAAGPGIVADQLADAAHAVTAGIPHEHLAGVGISSPGPLDAANGRIIWAPTLAGFHDIPITELLANRLGLPVRLENDGIAAALGEWRYGAGRGRQDLVYVTVSTGIGGGVVADGRVLRGRLGMAGHVGHMTIVRDGDVCSCGNRGCWEACASGTAFTRRARQRAKTEATRLGPDINEIDARAVFEAARGGDALARELVAEEADLLGTGLANLLHLYSPELVILGGGMANGFDMLHPGIAARVQASAMPSFRGVPIVRAELGDNSGLVGAAALVFGEAAAGG